MLELQDYSWPTPSGWVKNNATGYCINYIIGTTIGAQCRNLLELQFQSAVAFCVEDIQVIAGTKKVSIFFN